MSGANRSILLPSLLAAPASLYAMMIAADDVVIDIHETYPKQTLRNHYQIGSPNNQQSLVVPVSKPNGHRTKTSEIAIDYNVNWPLHHCKSLTTAYSKSPFFLYYADYIFAEFEKKHLLLTSLNAALQDIIMKWLGITTKVTYAGEFIRDFEGLDLRNLCKKNAAWELKAAHYQSFDAIFGFRSSLSVLDILFNLGPEAGEFLKKESTLCKFTE